MTQVQQLMRQRLRVSGAMRQLLDENTGTQWTADRQRSFDSLRGELDIVDTDIQRIRAAEDLVRGRVIARESVISAVADFARGGFEALSSEDKQRLQNTMSTTTPAQGGYTVASDVAERYVDTLKDFSGMRRMAEVIVTVRGNTMPWPTSDGTAEVGELVAENATATAADPTFGAAPLPTYRYSSKIFAVPFELTQDSRIDLEQFIFDRASSRIGRISNTHFTTGTGTGQPQGFVGAALAGKVGTTGQTLTVIHDDLVDLVHSVNTAYRQDPRGGVGFQMADTTFKVARKLKDTAGRPIYLPSDGISPEAIMGYPVIVNDDVPVPAANAKSIFFGNWRVGYKIRDALEVSLFRFTDSGYAKLGQVAFLAMSRSGGNLVDTAALKYYQHSAT